MALPPVGSSPVPASSSSSTPSSSSAEAPPSTPAAQEPAPVDPRQRVIQALVEGHQDNSFERHCAPGVSVRIAGMLQSAGASIPISDDPFGFPAPPDRVPDDHKAYEHNGKTPIANAPAEVLRHIISFLPAESHEPLSTATKDLSEASHDPAVWNNRIKAEFPHAENPHGGLQEYARLRPDLKAEVAHSLRGEELRYDGAKMAKSAAASLGDRMDFRIDGRSEREFSEAAIDQAKRVLAGRPEQLERFKADLTARFAEVFDADHALKLLAEESWHTGSKVLDEAAGRDFGRQALARAEAFFAQRPEQLERFRSELANYVRLTYGD
jgi:hypothetical protein